MKYDDLKNIIKEVLEEEDAWKKFLDQTRDKKSRKMVPWSSPPEKKKRTPEKTFDPSTDSRIEASSDKEAAAALKARIDKAGHAPGKQYVAKDDQGYFIRTIVDTRGT
jgi:hypothetical protein